MTRLNSIPMNVERPVTMPDSSPVVQTAEVASPASEAEQATVEAPKEAEKAVSEAKAAVAANPLRIELPEVLQDGAPYWARIPPNFVFPRGKQVIFMRFKSDWTDAPWKGEPIVDPETGSVEVDAHGKAVLYRMAGPQGAAPGPCGGRRRRLIDLGCCTLSFDGR